MIPEKSDPRWKEIVVNEKEFEQISLASKMIIVRVRAMIEVDRSPQKISEAIDIAHDYFLTNEKSVEEDLVCLFGKN